MHDDDPGRDGHEPLESYAAIGDGRTVALVGATGRIDWLPVPDIASAPVFARLLDAQHGGFIALQPSVPCAVSRRYVSGTNVLETTYTTDDGVATVTDALVVGVAGRLPWSELARRIEGVSGSVPFTWRVQPGTLLGEVSPWVEETERGAVMRCDDITVAVVGSDHDANELDATQPDVAVTGGFTATASSRRLLVVVATRDEPLRLPDPANVDRGIDRTVASWRAWTREFSYDGPWRRAVQRSALALKMLVHSPSGAIVAAATTSLPERPRGGKNWDYRFAWVRDLAYTVRSLVHFGLREETHAALSWLVRTIRANGPDLHVFYDLDGSPATHVEEHHAPGWAGIGPVVTGNPAQGQLQLGVYADVFAICRTCVDSDTLLDRATGQLLANLADRVCDLWRHPDSGMWELAEQRHYTSSKMGCWQALEDAVHLAERGQIPGDPSRWRTERERIRAWIEENCWNADAGAYVIAPGSEDLDASVLLHAISGFDRSERMSSTIDALSRGLGADDLLYRYTGADQDEHTFVACAFWLAAALGCVGRVDEATSLMDRLVRRTNDVGLLSEMIAEEDGAFWGNLPQALSHLALIDAALTIRTMADGARGRGEG
ncbi:glycoside hydrolase family 15 protein [Microbacterium betulae]|uniref:Glycoside hydrolase family 15 protein n=1 Tax=Microbacterium betulae TaxID=2981139 RepID=A0AA97FF70_9MICO|nr:glycoside hydrolase family 15 protein [Microbacterium sp. AB]WOF22401.1 glycoside hydrolase family 15 protein [Microbacterium sp. AB]